MHTNQMVLKTEKKKEEKKKNDRNKLKVNATKAFKQH